MEPEETTFEIIPATIKYDPSKVRKVIVSIAPDVKGSSERSLNATLKKGGLYNVAMIRLPSSTDANRITESKEIPGELVYESWSRKRLENLYRWRVDTQNGVIMTKFSFQQLSHLLNKNPESFADHLEGADDSS